MKQKDIALIFGVIGFSMIISLFISRALLVSPQNRQQQVEVVEPITAEFSEPDDKYFNQDSIDPTQLIQIGDTNNQTPFDSGE